MLAALTFTYTYAELLDFEITGWSGDSFEKIFFRKPAGRMQLTKLFLGFKVIFSEVIFTYDRRWGGLPLFIAFFARLDTPNCLDPPFSPFFLFFFIFGILATREIFRIWEAKTTFPFVASWYTALSRHCRLQRCRFQHSIWDFMAKNQSKYNQTNMNAG